jgi:hypothetical protein
MVVHILTETSGAVMAGFIPAIHAFPESSRR